MQKRLVDVVNDYCLRELGVLPDLINPQGYNDKVNWLKLYDQMPEHIVCSDKLRAREYVAERVGTDCLLEVYQTARSVDRIAFETLPERYVLKTNHDSGSVCVVTDRASSMYARRKIRRRLKRTYGMAKGEWAYAYISPLVFAEEFMHGPATDYKFHCSSGEIRWVQIIADRATGKPRETNVDEGYATLRLHFNHENLCVDEPPVQPETWEKMKGIARTLSSPFRYVRVDLYEYQARPIFGELTFWPLAGCCHTKDENAFGQLLNFDTTFKRPMVHDVVEGQAVGALRRLTDGVKRAFARVHGTAT